MPGAGFYTGLLETAGEGILERKKTQQAEEIARDKMKLARLQSEMDSPRFNPDHLPSVMAEMDELIGSMGKPKSRKSSGQKQGIFSQILGQVAQATGVGGSPEEAPRQTPEGRFLTQQQVDERAFAPRKKELELQNDLAIKLEQERQKRRTKIGSGIEGVRLPLGTQTLDGADPDPNQKYDLFQVGDGFVASPAAAKARRLRTHYKREDDGSFTAQEIDRDTGDVVSSQPHATPPPALLPNIRRGFKYFQNDNGEWVQVPETTITGKAMPGEAGSIGAELPAIPERSGQVVAQGDKPKVVAQGRKRVAGGGAAGRGSGMTPASFRVMGSELRRFANDIKQGAPNASQGFENLAQELGYEDISEAPLEEIMAAIAPDMFRFTLEEIEQGMRGTQGAAKPAAAAKKTATRAQIDAFAKRKGMSIAQVEKELKAAGYEVK